MEANLVMAFWEDSIKKKRAFIFIYFIFFVIFFFFQGHTTWG